MSEPTQFCYRYPRPALTVDCVVFGIHEHRLQLLLIQRAQSPFEGSWALPQTVIMKFPSLEAAHRWHDDPDYQALAKHRHASARTNLVLIDGLD